MTAVAFTASPTDRRGYTVRPRTAREAAEYGIVATMPRGDQNAARRALALLFKLCKAERYDVTIVDNADAKRWEVLVYTRNWPERAAYYAGILRGYTMRQPKRPGRRRLALSF